MPAKKAALKKNAPLPKTAAAVKPAETAGIKKTFCSPDNILYLWLLGWKKTFCYQGRSSRLELWSFLLINAVMVTLIQLKCAYTLSPVFLRRANELNYSLTQIENCIIIAETVFYLTFIIPLFPIGALIIRRMHDLNKLAWQNYLEPVFMGTVVLSMLTIALFELENTDYAYTAMLLSICFIVILYSIGYYGLKVLIMTFFYPGDTAKNDYGLPPLDGKVNEPWALRLSAITILFFLTVTLLYLILALL